MKTRHPLSHLTPMEYAALIDDAKARAHALRQQTIRAGWDTIGRTALRGWRAAWRWVPRLSRVNATPSSQARC